MRGNFIAVEMGLASTGSPAHGSTSQAEECLLAYRNERMGENP